MKIKKLLVYGLIPLLTGISTINADTRENNLSEKEIYTVLCLSEQNNKAGFDIDNDGDLEYITNEGNKFSIKDNKTERWFFVAGGLRDICIIEDHNYFLLNGKSANPKKDSYFFWTGKNFYEANLK